MNPSELKYLEEMLDLPSYEDVLRARELVQLRGVGSSCDGNWYIKSVEHKITRVEYETKFRGLRRECA
jgi:phage protein D